MRELIGRVEVVDDDMASALRVIAHFDSLVAEQASVGALLRAAAALSGSVVGHRVAASGRVSRVGPDGQPLPASTAGPARLEVPADAGHEQVLWLEGDTPRPHDQLILERCAQALSMRSRDLPAGDQAGAVRLLLDPQVTSERRQRAAITLGLRGPFVVTAALPHATGPTALAGRRVARIGEIWAVLLGPDGELAGCARAGSAAATIDDAPTAFDHASLALRLTGDATHLEPTHLDFADLGSLGALAAAFSVEQAAAVPDVQQVGALLTDHPWVLGTLRAAATAPSLRQAAAALHVHHSTAQERITWLDRHLGYPVLSPQGRQRTLLTLTLWRLAQPLA